MSVRKSPLISPYFRLGMLDGFRALPKRPTADSLFRDSANPVLAADHYATGYSAGLDARPMPTYEIKPNLGIVGGAHRVLTADGLK